MSYIIDISIGNLLPFVAGTAMTWSSPVELNLQDPKLTPFSYALSDEEASWICSMLPLGAIFGPFLYGFLADKIGRKATLLICGVPFLLAFIAFAFSPFPAIYYVARFLVGMSIGGVFTVTPMYIGELSEPRNRGALGASMNCFICFGFFFSYAVGSYTSLIVFNVILAVFPAIFLLLFSIIATESPNYYVIKEDFVKAKIALEKLRSKEEEAINEELLRMQEKVKESKSGSCLDICRSKGLIKAFLICVGLLAFQQLSGINAVLFYAEEIFKLSGPSIEPKICSIIIGSTQFVTSFTTPLVVELLGRKILLLMSSIGIIFSEVPLGIYCHLKETGSDVKSIAVLPLVCLIGYIITFNIGIAILPWSMMGELFPDSVKFKASSTATAITWSIGLVVAKAFPFVAHSVGLAACFWIFASFCALSIPFILFYVVETKGKSLEEIQDILHGVSDSATTSVQT